MSTTWWPLLIAEIANSHGGDEGYLRDLAGRLSAGAADAVKFQPIVADEIVSFRHPMREVFESLEMAEDVWLEVVAGLKAAGKQVWFDVYGPRSLSVALGAGADGLKIHAMDADDAGLLDSALGSGLPVLLSCGGSTADEIAAAVETASGRPLCLMLGFQRYPTPVEEARVARIPVMRERFGVPVGYMDHAPGADPMAVILPCLAVGHGAVCVEKHTFLPDRETLYDHQSALPPEGIDALRSLLVAAAAAAGSPDLALSAAESDYRAEYRKPAVATVFLPVGHELEPADYSFVRAIAPEGETPVHRAGVSAMLGRALAREVRPGEALTEEAFA